ncbi:MAG: hypothetical protein OXI46_10135 [Gemmatimonadota bacterium]|nr:hypothetical protein [Gemmatimonadota bacterium]
MGAPEPRPIYWNLLGFAFIGGVFAVIAMFIVEQANRSEIAVLYLGLIGGYAASIKELDLAKIEIDKLRAERELRLPSVQPNADEAKQAEPGEGDKEQPNVPHT